MCFLCKAGFQGLHSGGNGLANGSGFNNTAFLSGNNTIDSLMLGIKWGGVLGASASVTYAFKPGVTAAESTFQTVVNQALGQFSSVANITFQQLQSAASANMTFELNATLNQQGLLGVTYPTYAGNAYQKAEVEISAAFSAANLLPSGTDGYLTILHEIGHAIGFKHTGQFGGGGEITPFLNSNDNTDATVMSYDAGPNTPAAKDPDGLMIYDIQAMQHLYGANHAYNAGNDVYSIGGTATAFTIWDGSGVDTLVTTNYNGASSTIDLREGIDKITSVGQSKIWIAFGANIENVDADNGNNSIFGNDLSNFISARMGNDFIQGGQGEDLIWGGKGVDSIFGGKGNDTINGNISNDYITGNIGDDFINGGQDSDTIFGAEGNDTLSGDKGEDILVGGDGSDVFMFMIGGGADVVQDFTRGTDKLKISPTLSGSALDVINNHTFVESGSVVIRFNSSDVIVLAGINTLASDDIIIG